MGFRILGLLVFFVLAACSTPEERIEKLNASLSAGKIDMATYNTKLRKLDHQRLKETRERFMSR